MQPKAKGGHPTGSGARDWYSVPRSHPGGTVFILGGGPSLAGQGVKRLAGRPTIAINLSYSLAPWASYVYAQDARFLRRHRPQLEKRFAGRAVTISRRHAWPGLLICRKTQPGDGLPKKSHQLAGRRTSFAGAISIAAHMVGPGGHIVLLGADGGRAPDGRSHHHAAHPWPVKDESWPRQAIDLALLKPDLERMGIAVTNCSPGTKWTDLFPVMSLSEFLAREGGMSASDARREEYRRAFEAESARVYPTVDLFIGAKGHQDIGQVLIEAAAVLACPLKARPPNWQHGRVLYFLARQLIAHQVFAEWRDGAPFVRFLDIGTAKGFSAVVLCHAIVDGGARGEVHTLDVVDPRARVSRNTIAEIDGFKTVEELTAPFMPKRADFEFYAHACAGMFFDRVVPPGRIHLAFVDGKHKLTDVLAEATGISHRQHKGDVIMFDDLQIPAVAEAVQKFLAFGGYGGAPLPVNADRVYYVAAKL